MVMVEIDTVPSSCSFSLISSAMKLRYEESTSCPRTKLTLESCSAVLGQVDSDKNRSHKNAHLFGEKLRLMVDVGVIDIEGVGEVDEGGAAPSHVQLVLDLPLQLLGGEVLASVVRMEHLVNVLDNRH